jgi:hypothetical protein
VNFDKRIENLQASLRLELIFLRWLERTLKFHSRGSYISWYLQDLGTRAPLDALFRDLEQLQNSKSAETDAERRNRWTSAAEDLVYRFFLFWGLNILVETVLEESRQSLLKSELMKPARLPPVPVSEEIASIVRHATEDYVMPLDRFFTKLIVCVGQQQTGTSRTESETLETTRLVLEKIAADVAMVALEPSGWIDLGQLPYRSLGRASLVDGKWVDGRIVELAEYAALLHARGYEFRELADSHPLEELTLVRSDGGQVRDEDLLAIRKEARARLRGLKARTRRIHTQRYLNIDDYRAWDARVLVGVLKPCWGIKVADWNQWRDSQGEGPAEVAGVALPHLRTPFSSRDVLECKSEDELCCERLARRRELERVRRMKVGSASGQVKQVGWRTELAFASFMLSAVSGLVDKTRQLFGEHQVLFKETQENLDQLIQCAEALIVEFHLLDRSAQRNAQRTEGRGNDSDSFLNPGKKSEQLLKSLQFMSKINTLQILGRAQAADKVRREWADSELAALEAAKSYQRNEKQRFSSEAHQRTA